MAVRYFLGTDCSGHWYVVPQDRVSEWDEWTNIPEDDERSWDAPVYAKPVGGAPSQVTFADPFVL